MLELGRAARAEGLSFEDFWQRAVRPDLPALTPRRLGKGNYAALDKAIVWPSDTAERADAQAAMMRSEGTWRRAYNLEPATPGDLAMAALHAMHTEKDTGGIEAGAAVTYTAA
jgi:hypothetical protein